MNFAAAVAAAIAQADEASYAAREAAAPHSADVSGGAGANVLIWTFIIAFCVVAVLYYSLFYSPGRNR